MDGETIVTLTEKGKATFRKENTGISFSKALSLLKLGMKVKRENWGGYWILSKVVINSEMSIDRDGAILDSDYFPLDDNQLPEMIVAKLKNGGYAPATPYQGDLLAEDWEVIID